jgi:hypothetical protein
MTERLRYPRLWEAVRTSWHRDEDEYSTVDAVLLDHVNHVLRNEYRTERGWGGFAGGMAPAPDVTAVAIQRDAHMIVDGVPLDAIRIDTDPHVYALAAALTAECTLSVVVPRAELDRIRLEFRSSDLGSG